MSKSPAFARLTHDVQRIVCAVPRGQRPLAYASGANDEPPLASLRGLGPMSVAMLVEAGVDTTAKPKVSNPFTLYLKIKRKRGNVSINLLYALIGAIEDRNWCDVA
jgi:DNA transformation protein and related proteins